MLADLNVMVWREDKRKCFNGTTFLDQLAIDLLKNEVVLVERMRDQICDVLLFTIEVDCALVIEKKLKITVESVETMKELMRPSHHIVYGHIFNNMSVENVIEMLRHLYDCSYELAIVEGEALK